MQHWKERIQFEFNKQEIQSREKSFIFHTFSISQQRFAGFATAQNVTGFNIFILLSTESIYFSRSCVSRKGIPARAANAELSDKMLCKNVFGLNEIHFHVDVVIYLFTAQL